MNRFSLSEYAIFAGIFLLGTKNAYTEIKYTDIDPDIVIDEEDELHYFDIDSNGIEDFFIFKGYDALYTYTYYGSPADLFTGQTHFICPLETFENAIAGSNIFFSTAYGVTFSRYYPFALSKSVLISVNNEFQNGSFQRLCFKSYKNFSIPWDEGGNWFPEKVDRYLGIKFKAEGDYIHYGWIRCSVIDSGEVLIIKDYAYELNPDEKILTGSTNISTDGSIPIVYTFGSTVYIHLFNEISTCLIYDIAGRLVLKGNLNLGFSQIVLPNRGIYEIVIKHADEVYVKTIMAS